MTITVKYFAAVRERLGRQEERIDQQGIASVADVWQRVGGETNMPRVLAAVNQEFASPGDPVHDGDEVAFFPPVTGG